MALIDYTYFQNGIVGIPNLSAHILDDLNWYIDTYEEEYLRLMLGDTLYNEFMAGLAAGTIDQKWLDLRDGKEYNVSGIDYKWGGFINNKKTSPIAFYVFCKYLDDKQSFLTGIGEVKPSSENSIVTPPYFRMGRAWTEMYRKNLDLNHFLIEFNTVYENYSNQCKSLLKPQNVAGI